jgi:predicted acyl esterase
VIVTGTGFAPIMRPGVDPHTAPNKPPLPPIDYALRHEAGLVIERNVAIPLRDGVRIYADVYRPEGPRGEADLPVRCCHGAPMASTPSPTRCSGRDRAIRNGFRR